MKIMKKQIENTKNLQAAEPGKHPTLYGFSCNQENVELTSVTEVANFIYTEGLNGDVLIIQADGMPFISTFGIFIDRIADASYRQELLEVLVPLQMGQ